MSRRILVPSLVPILGGAIVAILLPAVSAGAVHAMFDLASPARVPFPSDHFTVRDREQLTHRRVNLPLPDCAERPSDCEDVRVLNTLDGFHVNPRLSIPFDGPINVSTVNSEGVFLVRLGPPWSGDRVSGINEIVWDPGRNTLFVKSDRLLRQHTRYALIVTDAIRDPSGLPVEESHSFRSFSRELYSDYKAALTEAIEAARDLGIRHEVVAASVFTTQSVTAVLERIRDQIKAGTPSPARFDLGPNGVRTVFPFRDIGGITFNQQIGGSPARFNTVRIDTSFLTDAVGKIAFGKYVSPDYETHPGEFIEPVATRHGNPVIRSSNEVYFNLYLPAGKKPAGGWPVAIYGHGGGDNKNFTSFFVAGRLAAHGIATIAINVVGHGFGPLGTLSVSRTGGQVITFPAGGRGVDQNADGTIASREGVRATAPQMIVDDRDGFRQTVVDLMQLVHVIEAGVDVDGDRSADLDPAHLYYFGHSVGGMYGTVFLAIEPDVHSGVLIATGGPRTTRRFNGIADRSLYGSWLASRVPPLINAPGVTQIDGVSQPPPFFNENLPLRDGVPLPVTLEDGRSDQIQSPVSNSVPGAIEIQDFFENTEWVIESANPVAYARHLRKYPLPGVPAKNVIVQFARGDESVPNPANSALLREGGLEDRATLYRNDLAFVENPSLPKNPHGFIFSPFYPMLPAVPRGALEQVAVFFASDGAEMIQPEPVRFFEVPVVLPLPEDLEFIP
jgi:pimeloyl-ACP methyl ester carboxylesterase